jgi:hypothetical protein
MMHGEPADPEDDVDRADVEAPRLPLHTGVRQFKRHEFASKGVRH